MIGIASQTAGGGHIVISESPKSKLYDSPARISRVSTLDGGVVLTHSGVAHGDRTMSIVAIITEAQAETLQGLHEDNTLLDIVTPEGLFYGAISRLRTDNGELKMTILIKEKVV